MQHRFHRKTAPRVVGGRPMRKNRHEQTRGLIDETRGYPVVTRERPGKGYCHVVSQRDIHSFLEIVPDWAELSRGLHAIVLAAGSVRADGTHDRGVITLNAWDVELERVVEPWWYNEHAGVLERLGVPCEHGEDLVRCKFDRRTARDFHLLHVLLHELGHHHDRMTTRSRRDAARGEHYAEAFALERERVVWERWTRLV